MYELVIVWCLGAVPTLIVTVWIYSGKCREYKDAIEIKRARWCEDCNTKKDLIGATEVIATQKRTIAALRGENSRIGFQAAVRRTA